MPLTNPLNPPAHPVKTPREREAELIRWWDRFFLLLLGFAFFFVKQRKKDGGNIGLTEKIIIYTMTLPWVCIGYAMVFEVRKDFVRWELLIWGLLLLIYHWSASFIAIELWRVIYVGGIGMLRFWSRRELPAEKLDREVHERAVKIRNNQIEQSSGVPDTPDGHIPLGYCLEVVDEEVPAKYIYRSRNNFLSLHARTFPQHILVLGATGAGKTHFFQSLSHGLLNNTDWDYFLVDGKGDLPLAYDIANRMYAAQPSRGPVPLVSFDERISSLYNPFSGDKNAIYNRLSGMLELETRVGAVDYWYKLNQQQALQLVCGIGYTDESYPVPRSFSEIVALCNIPHLKARYKGKKAALALLTSMEESKAKGADQGFRDLALRIGNFDRLLGQFFSTDGFVLENTHGAIFSLESMSYGDSTRMFMRLFIEDLKDFINKRHTRPAVIVIDEFGEIGSGNILTLLRMARSKNVSIILASQTMESLGDAETRKDILQDCRTKILMGTDMPEAVAMLAGTKDQQDLTVQIENGEPTGKLTLKEVSRLKVDTNHARALSEGEAYLIRQGHVYRFQTAAELPQVPPSPFATAKLTFSSSSKTTWQPQPDMDGQL